MSTFERKTCSSAERTRLRVLFPATLVSQSASFAGSASWLPWKAGPPVHWLVLTTKRMCVAREVRHVELPEDQVRCHGPRRVAREGDVRARYTLLKPALVVQSPALCCCMPRSRTSAVPRTGCCRPTAWRSPGCSGHGRRSFRRGRSSPSFRRRRSRRADVRRRSGPARALVSSIRLCRPSRPHSVVDTVAPEVIDAQFVGSSISMLCSPCRR